MPTEQAAARGEQRAAGGGIPAAIRSRPTSPRRSRMAALPKSGCSSSSRDHGRHQQVPTRSQQPVAEGELAAERVPVRRLRGRRPAGFASLRRSRPAGSAKPHVRGARSSGVAPLTSIAHQRAWRASSDAAEQPRPEGDARTDARVAQARCDASPASRAAGPAGWRPGARSEERREGLAHRERRPCGPAVAHHDADRRSGSTPAARCRRLPAPACGSCASAPSRRRRADDPPRWAVLACESGGLCSKAIGHVPRSCAAWSKTRAGGCEQDDSRRASRAQARRPARGVLHRAERSFAGRNVVPRGHALELVGRLTDQEERRVT